jgi:hypothetical protein
VVEGVWETILDALQAAGRTIGNEFMVSLHGIVAVQVIRILVDQN